MILLNIGDLRSSLAKGLGVSGGIDNLEIAFIDISEGGPELRRAFDKFETLDVGLRV